MTKHEKPIMCLPEGRYLYYCYSHGDVYAILGETFCGAKILVCSQCDLESDKLKGMLDDEFKKRNIKALKNLINKFEAEEKK